ncbi:MAG: von Willebrand factor type A domain-containing protein [Pirellulales bacterium]|nr:von Willebrand factor type A domain-containing protein [Pirellulales bacterium]
MSPVPDPKRDELEDRLMDQALREVLGGETPPELSERVLAAAEKQKSVSPQRKEPVMSKSRGIRWIVGALAACLVVGVTVALLLPAGRFAREAARGPDASGYMMEPQAATVPRAAPSSEASADDESSTAALPQAEPGVGARPPAEVQPGLPHQSATEHKRVLSADLDIPFSVRPLDNEPVPIEPGSEPAISLEEAQRRQRFDDGALWGTSPSGQGPGKGGDQYDRLVENPFRLVKDHPLSTFSIDVDTASYANVRRFLLGEGRLPPPDAVRIEELVNYFKYDYAGPEDDVPFAAHIEAAACPWTEGHRLVRVGLKGKEVGNEERPESNLVFLLDVSGSMNSPDKLPLLKAGMKLLVEQMRPNDRVAIVVYASAEGLALPSTPGSEREEISAALESLRAGGSTAGGAGIELAYRVAQENFIAGGVNRVLLCTDGDFNVGTTSTGDLVRMVEQRAKQGVFLSVLGFGRGNLNDAMMENISNKGNGNYAYIDGITEAHKVLVEQMGGTLVTIAKDVKIQIEFNPARVAAYRLIGYENRILAAEDFNDDKKDAGEIGAGHTVTALYEVVPAGMEVEVPGVDPLKYQTPAAPKDDGATGGELLTLKLRYKQPEADTSRLLEFPLVDQGTRFGQASPDLQFAAAVASFGMLLRDSPHKGTATYEAVREIATASKGADASGYRAEFLQMVGRAKELAEAAGRDE